MLIDGKWIDAASGKRFETHNPATGELLATVAEGDAETSPRCGGSPPGFRRTVEQGQSHLSGRNLLLKLADLVREKF